MSIPYWITATLAATPAFAWVFLGLGIPWALALLPRKDWRDRALVLATAFVFGPGLLTVWMFVIGTLGSETNPLLRFELVFGGTVVLALFGAAIAWQKRKITEPREPSVPFAWDEKLLAALIGVALVVRWFGIAFWPFTAYDALWVYGYEGRLYTLLGAIPRTIDYYPQFLPLQFTYGQLAVDAIDDHAARAGLIFLHSGAILAVYVLGSRLVSRRAGMFAAALWALYPHVGEWSRFGDLEIPLTFVLTLASAFFLMAWTGQEPRRRYALLAGLTLGIALWTKPTAGAFVWGVLLLLAIDLVRVRFDLRLWRPRFEIALMTGLAAAPLGLVWYVRNLLFGHPPIVLPPGYWQTLAARSGIEFGWPLLALLVLLAYLYFGPHPLRPKARHVLIGLALVLAGLLPSILFPHRIAIAGYVSLLAGGALLTQTLMPFVRQHWSAAQRRAATVVLWALALALPYFVTWFVSYSYHYRLSFPIVPLMILPTATVLSWWIRPQALAAPLRRFAYAAAIVALGFTAIVNPLYDANAGWDWLWTDKLPDDIARYRSGNVALMDVVAGLQAYKDEHEGPLVVSAPGVRRLPFFFPLDDIRVDETPTTFDELNGVVYFIESHPEGSGAYDGIPRLNNQVLSALYRTDIMRNAWGRDDGIFRYDVYELYLRDRFTKPFANAEVTGVVFGGFVRFLGYDIGADTFWPGRRVFMHLFWEVLAPPTEDYTIYIHLRDADDNLLYTWDGPIARSEDGQTYYTSLVWEPKEFIVDTRELRYRDVVLPASEDARIVIGLYNTATGERVPLTINGKPAGAGYTLHERITVLEAAPETD